MKKTKQTTDGFIRTIIFLCVYFAGSTSLIAQQESALSASEIIEKIKQGEREIQNVQCKIIGRIPDKNNRLFYEKQWGYDHGKEFLKGFKYMSRDSLFLKMTDKGQKAERKKLKSGYKIRVDTTFDGNKSWVFRGQEGKSSSGRIRDFDPVSYCGIITPNILRGFEAKGLSRETLGEVLSGAKSISIKPTLENINSHSCYVVEAIGVDQEPNGGVWYDVKVWIDPKRGYRVLKMENYYSIPGKNRWKAIVRRIEDIELTKFGDIWFPTSGKRSTFSTSKIAPPKGMSQEEFNSLSSLEEMRKHATLTMRLRGPSRVLTVVPESVRINEGIPDEAFRIKFPQGCHVWDDFLQMGYVVGGKADLSRTLETISAEELASLPSTGKSGLPKSQPTKADKIVEKNPVQNGKPESQSMEKKANSAKTLFSSDGKFQYVYWIIGIASIALIGYFIIKRFWNFKQE